MEARKRRAVSGLGDTNVCLPRNDDSLDSHPLSTISSRWTVLGGSQGGAGPGGLENLGYDVERQSDRGEWSGLLSDLDLGAAPSDVIDQFLGQLPIDGCGGWQACFIFIFFNFSLI